MQTPPSIQSDRYTIEKLLGAGEIGVVFRAHDHQREEPVALKTIKERSAEHTYNLKREFRALQKVQHPNLVRLHELVVDGEDAFFSMELVDGHHILEDLAGAEHLFDVVRERFAQLAVGICALHRAEKLHRDLKPTNVLIERRTGRVVIVDFGLAVATQRGQTTASVHGQLAGTYAYMPPEQGWGHALTPAADWYAFGVTLFEALVGHLPWPSSAAEAFQRKQSGPVPSAPLEARGVPADWIRFVQSLTQPEAKDRPTADEILRFFSVEFGETPTPFFEMPLFGREESSERWRRALSAEGERVVVEVTGRSGIGKTTFLQHHLHERTEGAPIEAYLGSCYDDVTAPFAALDELVDNITRRLLEVPPKDIAQVTPDEIGALTTIFPILERVPGTRRGGVSDPLRTRRMAARALGQLLERLRQLEDASAIRISLDDLQWADSESAHFLCDTLSFVPPTTRVEMIVAHRNDTPSFFVDILRTRLEGARWTEIELAPLSTSALERLAMAATEGLSLTDDEREERVARVVQSSAGIPFNAALLARVSAPAGALQEGAGSNAAWMRLLLTADLSALEGELLTMAAVSHVPLSPSALLRAAAVTDEDAAFEALETLERRSLLRQRARDGRWEMSHDRIRVIVVAALGEPQREALERQLAEALDADDDERMRAQAWTHWRAVGDVDRAAWGAYYAGKDAAAKLAFAQAIDCFEQALLSPESTGESLDEILRQLGQASALLGRVHEAVDQLLMAAAHAPSQVAIDDERQAAELLIGAGEIEKGKNILAQTFAKIGERLPHNSLGRALAVRGRLRIRGLSGLNPRSKKPTADELLRADTWWVAVGALGYVEPIASFIAQNEHLRRTLAFDEPNRLARALALEMVYLGSRLGNKSAVQLEQRLSAIPSQTLAPDVRAFISLSRGYLAFLRGQFLRAEETLEETLVAYESLGARRWQENLGRIHLVFCQLYLGDFHRAASLYDEHRHVLQSTNDRLNLGMLELGAGFAVALAADDVVLASNRIEKVSEDFPNLPDNLHYIGTFARVQTALYLDDIEGARLIWEGERKTLKPMLVFENVWIVKHWVDGLLSLHSEPKDVDVALRCAKKIERANTAWGDALASVLRCGVAAARERGGAVDTAFTNAIAKLRQANMETHATAIALWQACLLDDADSARRKREKMMAAGLKHPVRWLRLWIPGRLPPTDLG